MCSSLSSTGNDLGVWYFNRDGCWACVSVHLYNPQLTSGNEEALFYAIFLRSMVMFIFIFMDSFTVQKWFYKALVNLICYFKS